MARLGRLLSKVRSRGSAQAEGLVAACGRELCDGSQAFLDGTYRHRLTQRNLPVPPWAWVNELAHGSLGQITALAEQAPGSGPEAVAAGIARQLLMTVQLHRVELATLQSRHLIPLEDRLQRTGGPGPTSGEDLVGHIRSAGGERRPDALH